MDDIFVLAEETSEGWVTSRESRKDLVDRLNNMIEDCMQDDEKYKAYLIDDIYDDYKIADAVDAFIGYVTGIERNMEV